MKVLLRAYRYLNMLSIDVAAGAGVGAAFFARVLNVELFPQAYVVLGLTVWIIYTSDHLMDAFFLKKPASTPRHLFHQKHFRLLAVTVAVALVLDLALVLLIRRQLMIPGMVMAVMCAAYLVFNRWLRYVKEVAGTLLYSAGVLLPALSINQSLTDSQALLVVQFVFTVFINMLLFAKMSYPTDLRDQQNSLVTTMGLRASNWLITLVFVLLAVAMLMPSPGIGVLTRLVIAAMALPLLLIFLLPDFFSSEERYRLLGDSVFLLPGLLLIFQ